MKKKIVIVGTNEFSEYVFLTIQKEHAAEVVAFATLKDYISLTTFCGMPVLPIENLSAMMNMEDFHLLITVGYTKMNKRRENTYNICKKLGYKIYTYISNRAICDSNSIGEGSIIMPMAYIPPGTTLGICNIVNSTCVLGHTSKIGDFNWFSSNVTMGGNVQIDNNCFVGMNSVIKNGVHMLPQTMLGAFSYLNNNTIEGRFYVGNPATNTKKLKSIVICDFI